MAMDEAELFTAESILAGFSELEDPRSTINRVHSLGELIVISIMAVVAGADGPYAIGVWAEANAEWLSQRLSLPGGIPSHDTIGRVLMALKPDTFQKCFESWIAGLAINNDDVEPEIVAIDGKALRRSFDRKAGLGPLFTVSAWSVRRGLCLGQLATSAKSNEITAIPELIEQIDVKGAVVTIDAAGCQKSIAAKIVDHDADYVLALKGNQGNLYKSVVGYILDQTEKGSADKPARKYQETLKGHGRVDEITYYQFPVPSRLEHRDEWRGLKTIGVAIRHSEGPDGETGDARYYISSLKPGVKWFATCIRSHWSIENSLHWRLDVTFREDESRVRNRVLAENQAWLKRFAISLLKQVQDKKSIVMRRRMAGWNPAYLEKALGFKP